MTKKQLKKVDSEPEEVKEPIEQLNKLKKWKK